MASFLVSVVVPVYNAEPFLSDCIESIINQTHPELDIILVNNGSTDNSLAVCESYASKFNKIRVFDISEKGVCYARNCGIQNARGDYLCFVDSDDVLQPWFLKEALAEMLRANASIFFGTHTLMYGERFVKKQPRLKTGIYDSMSVQSVLIDDGTLSGILFGSVCGCLYSRALLQQKGAFFHNEIKKNEDGLFNIELLGFSNVSFIVSEMSGYCYRQWKSQKKAPLIWDDELDKCTQMLEDECRSFKDYSIQIARRKISVLFWNSIQIRQSSLSFIKNIRAIKGFRKRVKRKDFRVLDYSNTKCFKKILVKLLEHNLIFLFAFVLKMFSSIAEKRIKR